MGLIRGGFHTYGRETTRGRGRFVLLVKEEYRGKITYQEGDSVEQDPLGQALMGVILGHEDK